MAETKGRQFLTEKDFVDVVDAEGNDLPPVPKHWGEDQLPAGAKKKGGGKKSKTQSADDPDTPPKGNASGEEWAEWAKRVKGAKDEDLVDGDGNALGRDQLKEKFAGSGD